MGKHLSVVLILHVYGIFEYFSILLLAHGDVEIDDISISVEIDAYLIILLFRLTFYSLHPHRDISHLILVAAHCKHRFLYVCLFLSLVEPYVHMLVFPNEQNRLPCLIVNSQSVKVERIFPSLLRFVKHFKQFRGLALYISLQCRVFYSIFHYESDCRRGNSHDITHQ